MLARTRADEEREALCTIIGVVGDGLAGGYLAERHHCKSVKMGRSGVAVSLNQSINWGDKGLQSNTHILQVNGEGLPGNSSTARIWRKKS